MNIRNAGGNYKILKKYITLYKLDTSHFNAKLVNNEKSKENGKIRRIPLKDILVQNSSYSRTSLKKRLYDEKLLQPICCLCGQDENWNGMKI